MGIVGGHKPDFAWFGFDIRDAGEQYS